MFGFLRKIRTKKAESHAVVSTTLSDEKLLMVIRGTFAANDDTAKALFLIAYENFPVYSALFFQAERAEPQYGASLDGFARFLEESHRKCTDASVADEAGSCRFHYLEMATLLKILELRAKESPELWDGIAALWVELLPGARALRKTVDRTRLWRAEEIEWFRGVKTESEGETYCITVLMPQEVRHHQRVVDWQERDLPPQVIAEIRTMERMISGE